MASYSAGLTKSMDETQNNGQNNWELDVVEPASAGSRRKARKPSRISDHKLDKALKDLDLLSVSSQKLRGFSTIGRFLDQIGIVEYGNGRLVGTAEAMETAIRACADVVANAGDDHDRKDRFITLQIRLARAVDNNIALLNKISDTGPAKKPQPEQQNKPFAVQGVITPIQITLNTNPVATPEKTG